MRNWKSAILATTILAAAQPALAQPWDPATAIGGTSASNAQPSGPWSTVRMTGTGCNTAGTLAQLGSPYINPLAPTIGGRDGNLTASQDQPLVARNFGPAVTPDFTAIPANALVMHPGPQGECSIVRLTVPPGGSGTYSVSGRFAGAYTNNGVSNGDGVRGMVLHNGVGVGNVVETRNGVGTVQSQMRLCPGDTVDFAIHMRENYFYDSTLLTGRVVRTGALPLTACVTEATATGNPDILTGVTPVGDPIDMTGTPNRPRSTCCAPWAGADILPALVPTFPTGATGPYTMSFTPSATLNAQMSAYLNYLHAMNPGVTQLTMSWQAANLGTGATAATSGTMIGGAQNVTWQWTSGGVTMNGGGFWTGAPFPIGSWIGFQTIVSVNGGQAGASLLGPDCRVNWSAWRAQAQQIVQGGSNTGSGRIVFESLNARGQVQRTRPIDVRPGVAIETGQLLIRN